MCILKFRRNKTITEPGLLNNQNEYIARHIILNELKPLDKDGISYNSDSNVHSIIIGDSNLCYSIARQIAFIAHYPNFNEDNGKNRTIITLIIYNKNSNNVFENLKQSTGNLLNYCKYSFLKFENNEINITEEKNENSYIDIEFQILDIKKNEIKSYIELISNLPNNDSLVSVLYEKLPNSVNFQFDFSNKIYQNFEINSENYSNISEEIEINKAQIINTIYAYGNKMQNVAISEESTVQEFSEEIENVVRFSSKDEQKSNWKIIKEKEIKLSNIICGDCFDTKMRSIMPFLNDNRQFCKILKPLSHSEHTRWCVEKLILGYRPYTSEEKNIYNSLSNSDQSEMKKSMKSSPEKAHLNICSNSELDAIDHNSIKYDTFITLAIDKILKK